jgi:hypothetical protein
MKLLLWNAQACLRLEKREQAPALQRSNPYPAYQKRRRIPRLSASGVGPEKAPFFQI